jgi:uncharacterized protein YjbI with pentapeptide repeats
MPIAQFYIVAPFVVLVLFVYLHLSLQRLWNYLAGARFSTFNNCHQRCFAAANVTRAILADADLPGADLKEAILDAASLDDATLLKADLRGASMVKASLRRASLEGAQLSGAVVPPLRKCFDAQNACAVGPDPSEIAAADLSGADLLAAELGGAELGGVNLQDADLRSATGLTLAQLATVKTRYKAKLDRALLEQVTKTYPHLLQRPR